MRKFAIIAICIQKPQDSSIERIWLQPNEETSISEHIKELQCSEKEYNTWDDTLFIHDEIPLTP